jgi:hypothetical protein
LGAGGWLAADTWLMRLARRDAADRWAELRTCLLGEGLVSGQRPSERMRLVALAEHDSSWPERCMASATALDDALSTPSVRRVVGGELPAATAVVRDRDGARLDLLAATLERADLPAPRGQNAVPVPRSLAPLLRGSDLEPWATAGVAAVSSSADPRDGNALRILVSEARLLCTLAPDGDRWRHAECREIEATQAPLRLARGEHGAALVVYRGEEDGVDAWLDATTGQRVWRPRDAESQAMVRESGVTTVLHAERYEEGGIKEHRVVQLRPGKPPTSKRLSVPREARTLLLRDAAVGWFFDGDGDVLTAQKLGDGERWLGARRVVGRLPSRSSYVEDCASGGMQAVLFASGRRHALLVRDERQGDKVVELGMLEGDVRLSCHGDSAVVLAHHRELLRRLRCTLEGCAAVEVASPLFEAVQSMAAIGTKVALLWRHPGEPLRLRMSPAEQLPQAEDALLVDDATHQGIDVRRARLVGEGSMALAFLESEKGELFALRITESGDVKPARASH